jgi:hypothetical protein
MPERRPLGEGRKVNKLVNDQRRGFLAWNQRFRDWQPTGGWDEFTISCTPIFCAAFAEKIESTFFICSDGSQWITPCLPFPI